MTDVVSVFLDMFGWSYDMLTVVDVINNFVRLAIGIGIFVFIMKMPGIFLGRRNRLLQVVICDGYNCFLPQDFCKSDTVTVVFCMSDTRSIFVLQRKAV